MQSTTRRFLQELVARAFGANSPWEMDLARMDRGELESLKVDLQISLAEPDPETPTPAALEDGWESVFKPPKGIDHADQGPVQRFKVPGGWLYRTMQIRLEYFNRSDGVRDWEFHHNWSPPVFVPEPAPAVRDYGRRH